MPKQLLNIAIVVVVVDTFMGLMGWFEGTLYHYVPFYYDAIGYVEEALNVIIRVLMVLILYFYFRHREANTIWIIYLIANSLSVISMIGWQSMDSGSLDFEFLRLISFGSACAWLVYFCFLAFGQLEDWAIRVMGFAGAIPILLNLVLFDVLNLYDFIEYVQILGFLSMLSGLLWIVPFMALKKELDEGDQSDNSDAGFKEDEYGRYRKD